jgi:hypothetical protein
MTTCQTHGHGRLKAVDKLSCKLLPIASGIFNIADQLLVTSGDIPPGLPGTDPVMVGQLGHDRWRRFALQ